MESKAVWVLYADRARQVPTRCFACYLLADVLRHYVDGHWLRDLPWRVEVDLWPVPPALGTGVRLLSSFYDPEQRRSVHLHVVEEIE